MLVAFPTFPKHNSQACLISSLLCPMPYITLRGKCHTFTQVWAGARTLNEPLSVITYHLGLHAIPPFTFCFFTGATNKFLPHRMSFSSIPLINVGSNIQHALPTFHFPTSFPRAVWGPGTCDPHSNCK